MFVPNNDHEFTAMNCGHDLRPPKLDHLVWFNSIYSGHWGSAVSFYGAGTSAGSTCNINSLDVSTNLGVMTCYGVPAGTFFITITTSIDGDVL